MYTTYGRNELQGQKICTRWVSALGVGHPCGSPRSELLRTDDFVRLNDASCLVHRCELKHAAGQEVRGPEDARYLHGSARGEISQMAAGEVYPAPDRTVSISKLNTKGRYDQ